MYATVQTSVKVLWQCGELNIADLLFHRSRKTANHCKQLELSFSQ